MGARIGPDGLTEKQRRFVEAMMEDPSNATACAIKAGYSRKKAKETAYHLQQLPRVREKLDELLNRTIDEKGILDRTEGLEILSAIARGQTTEVIKTRNGEKEVPASVRDRIKATEILLRVQGAFVDRSEVTVSTPQFIDDL